MSVRSPDLHWIRAGSDGAIIRVKTPSEYELNRRGGR